MQIQRPKKEEVLSQLENNNFVINPILGVINILGFNTMMISIYLSQSGYVGMTVLLGTMGTILSFTVGPAEYLLTPKGIHQSLSPFVSYLFHIKPKERFFPFEHIW